MALLATAIVRALNHLLAGEPWARERLHQFAGQQVLIEAGPLAFRLAVSGDGCFTASEGTAPPAVTITLPPNTPTLFLLERDRIFAHARLAGAADFAETLGFVFRNLHWDAEADLAQLVGDIAARRLMQAGRHVQTWQADALQRGSANVAEYLSEEAELLVTPRAMADFNRDLNSLRDDLARLEKRLQRLSP